MFAYPKQSEFNRVIPKTKIYAHTRVSKRVKELFVSQVGEILWKHKLSPETVNLPARNGINEIQVFELTLRTSELDEAVLRAIDAAIPFPLLFQMIHDGRIRFGTSYKRPSQAASSKWVIEAFFQTEPQAAFVDRPPLPVALDLASLYEQIVRCHIPLSPRAGEGTMDLVNRFISIAAKQQAQQQLKTRLAQEKQFNRKVELNATLRSLGQELDALTQC